MNSQMKRSIGQGLGKWGLSFHGLWATPQHLPEFTSLETIHTPFWGFFMEALLQGLIKSLAIGD